MTSNRLSVGPLIKPPELACVCRARQLLANDRLPLESSAKIGMAVTMPSTRARPTRAPTQQERWRFTFLFARRKASPSRTGSSARFGARPPVAYGRAEEQTLGRRCSRECHVLHPQRRRRWPNGVRSDGQAFQLARLQHPIQLLDRGAALELEQSGADGQKHRRRSNPVGGSSSSPGSSHAG